MMILILGFLMGASFLLGSIPFGFLIARARGVDIRTVGSGNIGATNVNRALGSRAGIAVFLLDVLKGTGPSLAARYLIPSTPWAVPPEVIWFGVGMCALLGHMFSPWLGFKGGKGIATTLGVLLATAPAVAIIGFVIFLIVALPTRYISLASIIAAATLPISGWFVPGEARELVPVYAALAAFVIYKHRPNIARLRDGTESRFSFKK
jgi:glycerol-3-phosphate acyltransferase PlsY